MRGARQAVRGDKRRGPLLHRSSARSMRADHRLAARPLSARVVDKDVGMRRLLLLTIVLLALARPAFAHVEVSPESAPKGGAATFTFNAEDERDSANEVT